MALSVTFHAPPPVKTTIVIYKVDHVWIVNMEYTEATVTCRVQQHVKTEYVTHRMEHALHVSLDGPECIVKQVKMC